MLKKLSHPSLPDIVDVIDEDDRFLIVMDYIEGNSLKTALQEYGVQSQKNVIKWAKQLCDVLGYLHSQNPPIIYRDMKPANIMLKPDGNVVLIDFGTAREYKENNIEDTTCLGTMGYAAPEQFGGMGQTDARTDIYCLGATMYHLVTGMNPCEPPYEIRPIREIDPTLSGGLERIITKCTQPDPNNRYQSAAELMYDLEHYTEIDDMYRKNLKRKLAVFITTSVLTMLLGTSTVLSYCAAEHKKNENYNSILKEADTYDNYDNGYYTAIVTDPTRTEAYLKLNDKLTDDFVLDRDEAQILNRMIFYVSFTAFAIMLIASIVIFIVLEIPKVIGALTGKSARKGIAAIVQKPMQYHFASLTRQVTGEKIELNKPSFVLGKSPESADYAIADNTNVSRIHATIITRNGRYYVMDQRSTNGTFVNGRIIKPNQEVELLTGDCLMLANEEFVFGN